MMMELKVEEVKTNNKNKKKKKKINNNRTFPKV